MLSVKERKIMSFIYEKCFGRGGVLVSPAEFLSELNDPNLSAAGLARIVRDLAYDGYIDVIETDRKGEFIYCINLLEKGSAFPRELANQRRDFVMRIVTTIGLAVLSFAVGLVLKSIF